MKSSKNSPEVAKCLYIYFLEHIWLISSVSTSKHTKIKILQSHFSEHICVVASTSVANFVNWACSQSFLKDFFIFRINLLLDWISALNMNTPEDVRLQPKT